MKRPTARLESVETDSDKAITVTYTDDRKVRVLRSWSFAFLGTSEINRVGLHRGFVSLQNAQVLPVVKITSSK